MIVVNLYGGPGSGKSTTAAGVFHELKVRGVNAELVTEYAKDKVWDKSLNMLDNQLYIAAKQYHRQWRLIDQVDVIVTDSPLLLGLYYNRAYNPKGITARKHIAPIFESLTLELYKSFENVNYFLNRTKPYNPKGRVQTEEQSIKIDQAIIGLLNEHGIYYLSLDGDLEAHITIANSITGLLDVKKVLSGECL